MKTSKIQHIRLLIVAALMLVCGGWNGVVWGQIAVSKAVVNASRIHSIPYTITKNQNGNYENSYSFNIKDLLYDTGYAELQASTVENLSDGFYIRWYVIDKVNKELILNHQQHQKYFTLTTP